MKRNLVLEVLRDYDGRLFSQIRSTVPKKYGTYDSVVIDRQRGRQFDPETIISRARSLAKLTGLPYEENLAWPCKAERGYADCRCPRCVKIEEELMAR